MRPWDSERGTDIVGRGLSDEEMVERAVEMGIMGYGEVRGTKVILRMAT